MKPSLTPSVKQHSAHCLAARGVLLTNVGHPWRMDQTLNSSDLIRHKVVPYTFHVERKSLGHESQQSSQCGRWPVVTVWTGCQRFGGGKWTFELCELRIPFRQGSLVRLAEANGIMHRQYPKAVTVL
ncbi:hypothetical protein CBL_10697 [Carabus blaptoides fortunei]